MFHVSDAHCLHSHDVMFLSAFCFQIVGIASAALDEYRVESKKMVIALVDMERAFIPPQHFIRLVQRRCVCLNSCICICAGHRSVHLCSTC